MNRLLAGLLTTVLVAWSALVPAEQLAPGADFFTIRTDHPSDVFVVKFDRSDPHLELAQGWSQGRRSATTREVLTGIVSRYNDPPEFDVLAGVNASFFGSGNEIIGNLATGANYVQFPDSSRSWPVFAYNDPGDMFISINPALTDRRLHFADSSSINIDMLNETRLGDTLVMYTRDWGPNTATAFQAVEVVIEDVNFPMRLGKRMTGTVTGVRTGSDSVASTIPEGGVVLSARDGKADTLLNKVSVGDELSWRFRLADPLYNNSRMLVDGAGWILRDGAAPTETWGFSSGFMGRHPRTLLAWNDTHGFLIVVDGRSSQSVGMSFQEMAAFCRDELGATDAINLDGGGSSTMVADGTLRNNPSGGTQRAIPNAVLLVRRDRVEPLEEEADTFPPEGRQLSWDDKFTPNPVQAFSPASPEGDGHVMVVEDPTGGFEVARAGNRWDRDYFAEAWVYLDHRPEDADEGFERSGIFVYDQGQGAFDSDRFGGGNNYLMTFDSHTGEIIAGKTEDGVVTNFIPDTLAIEESGWHQFRIVAADCQVAYYLDGELIIQREDGTFSHGTAGVGYHSYFDDAALQRGARVDNFRWGRAEAPPRADKVIFEDNFEDYATDSDVLSTDEWSAFTGDMRLSTEGEAYSGTNAIHQPEMTTSRLIGGHAPVSPADITECTPLAVSFMYYDAHAGQQSVPGTGIRTGLSYGHFEEGAWGGGDFDNFFSIGMHHQTAEGYYSGRVVRGGNGWTAFDGTGSAAYIPRQTGWREMTLRILPGEVRFYVDGVLANTDTYDPVAEWNSMRLGSLTAGNDLLEVFFDDFRVALEGARIIPDVWAMY